MITIVLGIFLFSFLFLALPFICIFSLAEIKEMWVGYWYKRKINSEEAKYRIEELRRKRRHRLEENLKMKEHMLEHERLQKIRRLEELEKELGISKTN